MKAAARDQRQQQGKKRQAKRCAHLFDPSQFRRRY
jgi:hypothetical protein